MSRSLLSLALAGCGLLALGLVQPAQAQTSAYTIADTTGQQLSNPPFTLGFEFTANANVSVSALGLFDDSQDGLAESHDIGLFDSMGNLLASSTLDSGTTDMLVNQFRYVSIAPVALTAGSVYRVGAVYVTGADNVIFPGSANGFATDASITFDQSGYAAGSSLSDPTSTVSTDPGYFGPNLLLGAFPPPGVPEPGSVALLVGMSVSGAGFLLRKRRK